MKYPRTYHLPYSPGATKDDKKLKPGWFDNFKGKEIVITEKLDGENSAFTSVDVYSRSHGAPTRSPWSRNLWDVNDGLYWRVKEMISPDEEVFGENLFGEHSIHYDNLKDYFHIFAVNNLKENIWYSWKDVKDFATMLEIPHVPELWKGIINTEAELQTLVNIFVPGKSKYGDTIEGVVIRITDSFPIEDFPKYVCKWVRPNHVQTDEHWTRNWKKAQLKI